MKIQLLLRTAIAISAFIACQTFGQADEPIRFSRDVLPILADRCFHCHGPDAEHREAGLRLDKRESAVDEIAVIVPGDPDQSELMLRVTSEDGDLLMPPLDSNRKPLKPSEIEVLSRWIAEGAPWAQHWSFEKPIKQHVNGSDGHPIDAFIRKRLREARLSPSPPADKRTLIRRVTLDLIGLPPTLEELNAFLADDSPDAYENLVDRLLSSPHYGERMAWPWLDAARYADTSGFQGDPERSMWPWRDWVVDALNDNMPFDEFTIQQLAGDLLPNATPEQQLATGFNRNHMHNGEGGRIAEETRVENVFDRAETTATVWLGLTLQCARCHDHKFDPTSNEDYFAFYDFFNQTTESGRGAGGRAVPPSMDYVSHENRERLAQLNQRIATLQERLMEPSSEADSAQALWEMTVREAIAASSEEGTDTEERGDSNADVATDVDAEAKKLLGDTNDTPSNERNLKLREHFRTHHWPSLAEVAESLQLVRDQHAKLKQQSVVPVMVMDQVPKPRETLVLVKGVYNNPTDRTVVANVPGMLPPLPRIDAASSDRSDQGGDRRQHYNRLDLARWLVSPDNPLTARVTVNRHWQTFFGRAIVSTPSDFGLQGAQPTHPELLDWLAVEFIESGWNVKHLHRLIVTSQTYQQAAIVTADQMEYDPQNELLSRAPRYRMPSWMIRDHALAVSGLLEQELGGPPVKSYQPEGIWAEATFGKIKYDIGSGDQLYRRSLYSFWRRIVGPTIFFDAAKRQTCEVQPNLTNTPLHALTTLNDVTYVEAARVMAEKLMLQHETNRDRLTAAFQRLTSRDPDAAELSLLESRLTIMIGKFQASPERATELLEVGNSPRDAALDPAQHAALAILINTLMNLDEVLVKP